MIVKIGYKNIFYIPKKGLFYPSEILFIAVYRDDRDDQRSMSRLSVLTIEHALCQQLAGRIFRLISFLTTISFS
jgi:hypothetical protein